MLISQTLVNLYMGDLDDKYPHWKDALFGNHGLRANLRCGVKYMVWHGSYALLAFFGLLAMGIFGTLDRMADTKTAQNVGEKLQTSRAKKTLRTLVYAIGILFVLGFTGATGYLIYLNPMEFLAAIGLMVCTVVAVVAVAFGMDYLASSETVNKAGNKVASGASKVGQKSKVTPVARRVYGHCPVSMDLEPKWFENFEDKL